MSPSTSLSVVSPLHEAAYELIKTYLPAGRPLMPAMHLRDEIGLDSLEFVELAMSLESLLHVSLPDEAIGKWRTVEDVLRCLDRFVPQLAGPAIQFPLIEQNSYPAYEKARGNQ